MKSLSLGLCLIALCAVGADTRLAQNSQNGRYRLLRASISGRSGDRQCLFKIDSATGRTWKYSEGADGTNTDLLFFEIEDVSIRSTSSVMPYQVQNPQVWLDWAANNPEGGIVSDENGNRVRVRPEGVSNIMRTLQGSNTLSHESHPSH